MRWFLSSIVFGLVLVLSGCGFQLRGAYSFPYQRIFIATDDASVVSAGLKRNLQASGIETPSAKESSEVIFQPAGEERETEVVSRSSSGRVREKRLRYRYTYRLLNLQGQDVVLPGEVVLTRDLTYADSSALAKTQEEDLLWRDMENDLVQQLLRRLSAVRPQGKPVGASPAAR